MTNLVMQTFDIFLDGINELSLVFLDCATNLRSNEESIELREDSEHFIRIARCSKSVSQSRNDLVFDSRNTFVVCVLRSDPDLTPLCKHTCEVKLGRESS